MHEFPAHVAEEVRSYLEEHGEGVKDEKLYEAVKNLMQRSEFIEHIARRIIPTDGRKLKAILPPELVQVKKARPVLPDTPLGISALLTGASHTPKLYEQIKKELMTCDRADWMVSFIRMSGLVPLLDTLKEFTEKHAHDPEPCLRIATTVYMGVTDPGAIERLLALPNTEVRVSYDTKNTRLHAKSYIFHRATGFGSAYVGSSNISKVAMDNGLEWNIKVSQREIPHLWAATVGSFETHWEDSRSFEACRGELGLERVRTAIRIERNPSAARSRLTTFYDLHPYRYQEEALESIRREREMQKNKHLIVAATGTGKTMIAAFDYADFRKTHPGATLLFLAHRKEILEQAHDSFCQVLKDGSFGTLVDGNNEPENTTHWFCTIQSWLNRRESFQSKHFQYVVVDEAHHGAAASYTNILEQLQPESLLGLTATPERMDGGDIRPLFGGDYTHMLRLPDAIDRALLCPFVYYGLDDETSVDFSNVKWVNGKYDIAELKKLLDNNEKRAAWILEQMNMRLDEITERKILAFCVSVEHARAMANFCNDRGVPSIALTGQSSLEERQSAKERLASGEICMIFTVDLYNEGVDIPFIDTVVFLRPTESLTVFLQQLGRGLRRYESKECLVVFDFIAPQNRKFNYAQRYRALCTGGTTKNVERQLKEGFSLLPTGCSITLQQKSATIILRGIQEAIRSMSERSIVKEIRLLQEHRPAGNIPLEELLTELGIESPDELYKRGLPHMLQDYARGVSKESHPMEPYKKRLKDGFRALLLQSDGYYLKSVDDALNGIEAADEPDLTGFYRILWSDTKKDESLADVHSYVLSHDGLRQDLSDLIRWTNRHKSVYRDVRFAETGHLRLHASYTREQVMLAMGKGSFNEKYQMREGVRYFPDKKVHIFFADINKSEDDFSPTTMYDDYAISETLFHWQSQSGTSPESSTGQSYIHHVERGVKVMLFIRNRKKTPEGVSAPFIYAGPMRYISHTGSRPMSVRWRLEFPLPAHVLSWAAREA